MLTLLQLHQRREGHTYNKNRPHHALEGGSLLLLKAPCLQYLSIFGHPLPLKSILNFLGWPLRPSAHENPLYPQGKGSKTNRFWKLCHHQRPLVRRFRPKSSAKQPSKPLVTVHRRNLMTVDRSVIPAASLVLELRPHCHVGVRHPLALGTIAWTVEQVVNAVLTAELRMVTMEMGGP